jgi:hypothetical protein
LSKVEHELFTGQCGVFPECLLPSGQRKARHVLLSDWDADFPSPGMIVVNWQHFAVQWQKTKPTDVTYRTPSMLRGVLT